MLLAHMTFIYPASLLLVGGANFFVTLAPELECTIIGLQSLIHSFFILTSLIQFNLWYFGAQQEDCTIVPNTCQIFFYFYICFTTSFFVTNKSDSDKSVPNLLGC